jgi:hypothetical protein
MSLQDRCFLGLSHAKNMDSIVSASSCNHRIVPQVKPAKGVQDLLLEVLIVRQGACQVEV